MQKNQEIDLAFEPEIERLLRKNRRQAEDKKNKKKEKTRKRVVAEETSEESSAEIMAEPRRITLEDLYVSNIEGCGSSVAPPNVATNNFEIKPALTQLVRQE